MLLSHGFVPAGAIDAFGHPPLRAAWAAESLGTSCPGSHSAAYSSSK
jgi:hypothetical protein